MKREENHEICLDQFEAVYKRSYYGYVQYDGCTGFTCSLRFYPHLVWMSVKLY